MSDEATNLATKLQLDSSFRPRFEAIDVVTPSNKQNLITFFKNRSYRRVFAILGVGSAAFVGWILYIRYQKKQFPFVDKKSPQLALTEGPTGILSNVRKNDKKDKVILSQCPRGLITPCIAPFPMKLETYLRLAKIPYEVRESRFQQCFHAH